MPNEKPPVNAFKKGHKKVGGRPPGRRNILTNDLKEALLEAATRVGFVREVDVLDADGKPTGRKVPEWDGDGGLAGYLEWAAVYQPGHFIPQLGKVMPIQINAVASGRARSFFCFLLCSWINFGSIAASIASSTAGDQPLAIIVHRAPAENTLSSAP